MKKMKKWSSFGTIKCNLHFSINMLLTRFLVQCTLNKTRVAVIWWHWPSTFLPCLCPFAYQYWTEVIGNLRVFKWAGDQGDVICYIIPSAFVAQLAIIWCNGPSAYYLVICDGTCMGCAWNTAVQMSRELGVYYIDTYINNQDNWKHLAQV